MSVTRTKGFTLIELMITVAIVGILSSIAVPAYSDYMARARFAEILTMVKELDTIGRECLATVTNHKDGRSCLNARQSTLERMRKSPYIEHLYLSFNPIVVPAYEPNVDETSLGFSINVIPNWEHLGLSDGFGAGQIALSTAYNRLGTLTKRCYVSGSYSSVYAPYIKLLHPNCHKI